MERIWLKQYPAGVPADIDPTRYGSLVDLLEESFAKFADRKAFICMDKSISYRDLDEMSLALAAYLQSKGLQKGARVALMMPNVLQYPISTAAVLRAGYAVVNVNPLYTPRELEHQLKDSGAEAIVVLENFATTVQQALPLIPDGGSIILTGSVSGSMGMEAFSVYNASKAAIRSFARSWTADLKARNIRVNVVSPGPVQTPGLDVFANDDVKQYLKTLVPLGRIGTADEIAKAVLFLASEDSSYVAGAELFVDGGMAQV